MENIIIISDIEFKKEGKKFYIDGLEYNREEYFRRMKHCYAIRRAFFYKDGPLYDVKKKKT